MKQYFKFVTDARPWERRYRRSGKYKNIKLVRNKGKGLMRYTLYYYPK